MLDAAFYGKLLDGEAQGIYRSAEDALNLFASESGLDPKAKNSIGCVGLNQMCDGTLQAFYKSPRGPLSFVDLAEEYRNLPASMQLDAIHRLWSYRAKVNGLINATARDLYWLNFLPATFLKDAPDSFVIVPHPKLSAAQSAGILKANPGLVEKDASGSSIIRVAGLVRFLDKAKTTGVYKSAAAELQKARAAGPEGPPGPPPDPTPVGPAPPPVPPQGGPIAGGGGGTPKAGPIALGIGLVVAVLAAIAHFITGK